MDAQICISGQPGTLSVRRADNPVGARGLEPCGRDVCLLPAGAFSRCSGEEGFRFSDPGKHPDGVVSPRGVVFMRPSWLRGVGLLLVLLGGFVLCVVPRVPAQVSGAGCIVEIVPAGDNDPTNAKDYVRVEDSCTGKLLFEGSRDAAQRYVSLARTPARPGSSSPLGSSRPLRG